MYESLKESTYLNKISLSTSQNACNNSITFQFIDLSMERAEK